MAEIEENLTDNPRTRELLHHLATRPGHDEVKSDFRQLLVEEFGVELGALDFERGGCARQRAGGSHRQLAAVVAQGAKEVAIIGGESGPRARPMEAWWVEELHDSCKRQRVAFFFKQWGGPRKKKTGRMLGGRIWEEYPLSGGARSLFSLSPLAGRGLG